MPPEWVSYANLALNVLLLPLLNMVWGMRVLIGKLETQTNQCAKETAELKAEISGIRTQIISIAATTAATAATTAAMSATQALREK